MTEIASMLAAIDAETTRRAGEIRWLKRARQMLAETAALTPGRTRGTGSSKSLTITVEGRSVPVSTRQATVIRLLSSAGDDEIVPHVALYAIYGGARGNLTTSLFKLRAALKRAGAAAEIVNFKSENGYRLQVPQAMREAA